MAQALTKDFERRLKATGKRAGLDDSDVLNHALTLYIMALDADHVVLEKEGKRQEVVVRAAG